MSDAGYAGAIDAEERERLQEFAEQEWQRRAGPIATVGFIAAFVLGGLGAPWTIALVLLAVLAMVFGVFLFSTRAANTAKKLK
jgi:hypothetical protein